MAFELTKTARLAAEKLNLETQIVLEIDGVSTRYSAEIIRKRPVIGDDELFIDGTWTIGGFVPLADQNDLISLEGTSTSIRQQLEPDKGLGSSISSMQVALVDDGLEATRLASPGIVVDDMLGRRARVYLGINPQSIAFPEDYVMIFRGIVDDIRAQQGTVVFNLAHPDQKKRQTLFSKTQDTLAADIDSTYPGVVTDGSNSFMVLNKVSPGLGPFLTYLQLDDEWVEVMSKVASTVYTVSRGKFGTTAADHAEGTDITARYAIQGNVIDLALWLMLSPSDQYGPYLEFPVTSINFVDAETTAENAFFFAGIDLERQYGIQVGDQLACWDGAGGNLFSTAALVFVSEIESRYDGTVVYVSNKTLTTETSSTCNLSFYSQYAILPAGAGLGMKPDEVDIEEHLRIKRLFLSNFEVLIYLDENTNVKELIEKHLYAVAGAYSLPRKSKASVGYHIGPIPGAETKILSKANITKPSQLQVRRSLQSNMYNTIIYKFEEDFLTGEYTKGLVTTDATSKTRIPVGTKALVVEAKGLRVGMNGENLAQTASNRRLNRYKFGAEYIEQLKVLYKTGFNIEIGDIVLLDSKDLNLINSAAGTRSTTAKLYEVTNKTIDLKSGEVTLSLVDTNYSTQLRYALIGPASRIKTGISATSFVIEALVSSEIYGTNEGLKWKRFLESGSDFNVRVRSSDFARNGTVQLQAISGNTVTVAALGFVPQPGDIMEMPAFTSASETAVKLYGFMTNDNDLTFADGSAAYVQL